MQVWSDVLSAPQDGFLSLPLLPLDSVVEGWPAGQDQKGKE